MTTLPFLSTRPPARVLAIVSVLLLGGRIANAQQPQVTSPTAHATESLFSGLDDRTRALAEELINSSELSPSERDQRGQLVLESLSAAKVHQLTATADSNDARCLRIAQWITAHISNFSDVSMEPVELDAFARRRGLGAARCRLLVSMLSELDIEARIFNVYNFGRVGGGRNFVQAKYDGAWHFFDPTNGAVFQRDGKILSWEEIQQQPSSALQHLVVFEQTLDRSGDARVANDKRVAQAFTLEAITSARSFGFYQESDLKTLFATTDVSSTGLPLVIGTRDRDGSDVQRLGVSSRITEQLAYCLGTRVDTFHLNWELSGLDPERSYQLRFDFCNVTDAGLRYWAKATAGTLVAGQDFVTDDVDTPWTIEFRSDTTGVASLLLGYDYREPRKGLILDQLRLEAMNQ